MADFSLRTIVLQYFDDILCELINYDFFVTCYLFLTTTMVYFLLHKLHRIIWDYTTLWQHCYTILWPNFCIFDLILYYVTFGRNTLWQIFDDIIYYDFFCVAYFWWCNTKAEFWLHIILLHHFYDMLYYGVYSMAYCRILRTYYSIAYIILMT